MVRDENSRSCCGVHVLEWYSLIGITTTPAVAETMVETQLVKLSRDDKDFISVAEEVGVWLFRSHDASGCVTDAAYNT